MPEFNRLRNTEAIMGISSSTIASRSTMDARMTACSTDNPCACHALTHSDGIWVTNCSRKDWINMDGCVSRCNSYDPGARYPSKLERSDGMPGGKTKE
jgi:hypothetical protein